MKKVLAIAPYPYLPFFSGGQKFIARFFEYLGKEVDLAVISVAENDFSLANNYRTIPLLKRSFSRYYDRSLVSKITALVKKEGFDTIIWEHPYYAWLAFRIRKRTGVKTIIHTHNVEYQRFRSTGRWWWPILKMYERRSFKKADAIFFISPEDKNFAITKWKIEKEKCIDLPFGIDIKSYPDDKAECRDMLCRKHNISREEKILLFNGLLNYSSNLDALKVILDKINPVLLQDGSYRYKIIVCGKGLPGKLNSLKEYTDKNIIYAGFVDDIETYFKAADIFLNPVQSGGGVKTKMVEAIAFGTTVVATETGALGINRPVCGDKLIVTADNDWNEFATSIISKAGKMTITPPAYYEYYYWGNVLKNMLATLTKPSAGQAKKH
ncbi:MAG TPA: glycosyltransferase family 4 protein [Chitinophagaceae bacterium]|nr:glycosyltransferase family 4 protein [Chitinophagaceae bacterium]